MRGKIIELSVCTARSLYNLAKYGVDAPRCNQKVWIAPFVDDIFHGKLRSHQGEFLSGKVLTSDWPFKKDRLLTKQGKMRICYRRWVDGMTWEDAGAYKWMEQSIEEHGIVDGCKNREDIVERYERLDKVYHDVKSARGFHDDFYVNVHIGPDGTLFFGHGGGAHRIAIANILKLPVRAKIGLVHFDGFPRLLELRQRKKDFSHPTYSIASNPS
ncbi:MAG: hypothetical protein JJU08_14370 [Rhodobacteraceae bacterium]|nr:hypothetical protein [Paracoccaceae bacterium]